MAIFGIILMLVVLVDVTNETNSGVQPVTEVACYMYCDDGRDMPERATPDPGGGGSEPPNPSIDWEGDFDMPGHFGHYHY